MNNTSSIPQLPQASIYEPTISVQKIQPHYRFDSNNMPKIQCYYHQDSPNNYIKYFCRQPECLMPLCDKCVQQHLNQYHTQTQSNIVPFETILSEIYQNLAADCNEMCDQINKIQSLSERTTTDKLVGKQSLQTNPIKLIESARDQVIAIVNNYFETLKTYLLTQIEEPLPDINVKPALKDLKVRWEQNIKDLESINNPVASIEKVIEYCEEELRKKNDTILNDAEKLIKLLETSTPQYRQYGVDIPQLFVDPSFLPRFLWVLERYAFFNRPPLEPEVLPPPRIVEPIPVYDLPPPPRYYDPYPPMEQVVYRDPIVIREPVFRDSLIRENEYPQDFDEDAYRQRRYRGRQQYNFDYDLDNENDAFNMKSETKEKRKKSKVQESPKPRYKITEQYESKKKNKTSKSKGPKEIVISHAQPSYMNVTTTQIPQQTVYQPQQTTYQVQPTYQALQTANILQTTNNQLDQTQKAPSGMTKSKITNQAYKNL
ncbi:unnamed protein product [Paramecium pentaurelia]|uniref:B box-type domain-containing protein n=1 Tax=Paramecium pentaurelia TaxID=43138 RepID=A0A8S1U908_9CILI|nr:unnamed protein product [Paramecium pentaurelia]